MRYILCDFCGSDVSAHVLTGPDLLHGLAGEFTFVRCEECGLIYQNPQPTLEELAAYYPEDYEAHIGTRENRLGWLQRVDYQYGVEKRYWAIMRYFVRPGRMLDVGCGTGAFIHRLRWHGWEVVGIEPSLRAANYGEQNWDLEIWNSSFEGVALESRSFDLVTMWNVLEHLSSPYQALNRVNQALRTGGLLVFAVPSIQSYDLKIFGKYWAGYDLPRHLFLFPPKTLAKMIEQSGFDLLGRRCIYGTYNAFAYSARFLMNDWIANHRLRSIMAQLLLSLPVRAASIPLSRMIDLLNRGTIMTWFCRKR